MKSLFFALLLGASFALAQDNQPAPGGGRHKHAKGMVTVQGCVSRFSGDYILMKVDPAVTFELQGSREVRLGPYLGQEVEVTGVESPSMSTSADAGFGRLGSPSPVTISVHSIRSLAKRCPTR